MSIPKEPRQLMINLMYLVLTALLALNVSAEVMNAFFSLDKGIKNSMNVVETSNSQTVATIDRVAQAYKSENNDLYNQRAKDAQTIANDFVKYIDDVRTRVFELGQGASDYDPDIPRDIRNKDVTTNLFINEGKGAEIEGKIRETRQRLLELADNNEDVARQLPLTIEDIPSGSDAKNWPELKFKQMPIAAVFPILSKMQSDAKSSAASVLNYCAQRVSGEKEIRFDKYAPVVSAKKSYLIAGEKYEADIFLGAYSSQADNISISVNGSGLPVREGTAHYVADAGSLGTKTLKVSINVKNPLTNEVKNYSKDFEYEVGQRSVAVQLDKMNVFYIGVENPITVSAAGISSNDIRVSGSGVNVRGAGGSKYIVTASTPGEAKINISGGGQNSSFSYRVKRIPDPVPKLGAQYKGGAIPNGTFKAQGGIAAMLENFDFDTKCEVIGFGMSYLAKRQDPVEKTNSGARWDPAVAELIQRARPGDSYFFDDIKVKCPGDAVSRNLGSLAFKIR